MSKGTIHDFINKIDCEGGVYGALDYGLTAADYDLPPLVADKWLEIRGLFAEFEELVREFDILVDKAVETTPYGDEE